MEEYLRPKDEQILISPAGRGNIKVVVGITIEHYHLGKDAEDGNIHWLLSTECGLEEKTAEHMIF